MIYRLTRIASLRKKTVEGTGVASQQNRRPMSATGHFAPFRCNSVDVAYTFVSDRQSRHGALRFVPIAPFWHPPTAAWVGPTGLIRTACDSANLITQKGSINRLCCFCNIISKKASDGCDRCCCHLRVSLRWLALTL